MNRFLSTTATIALCTAWSLGSVAAAGEAAPAAAQAAPQPKTMQDAINAQLQNAKELRMQGKVDDAAKALSQLMLVAPDNAGVVGEYGKALTQQGHSPEAVAFLTRATQLQANDWTLFSALGVAYDQLDKRKEAREAYDRALALKPGEPSILNNYAVSRMLAGDYVGAQKMLDQVQAMGTNDPKVAGNLAKLAALEAEHPSSMPKAAPASAPAAAKNAAVVVATGQPPVSVDGTIKKPSVSPHLDAVTKSNATHPPAALVVVPPKPDMKAPVTAIPATALASAASTGGVMMEKVPVDPLAGPVGKWHSRHAPAAAVATTSKPDSKTPVSAAPATTVAATAPKADAATPAISKVTPDHAAAATTPHEATGAPRVLGPAAKHQSKIDTKSKAVLAKATPPATMSPPPRLRTASDSN